MPRLVNAETKARFSRQVVKVHQSNSDGSIFSYCKAYLYALDGSRIGFCDMFSDDNELQYPE